MTMSNASGKIDVSAFTDVKPRRVLMYHTSEARENMSPEMKKAYVTAKKRGGRAFAAFKHKAKRGLVWTKYRGKYVWKKDKKAARRAWDRMMKNLKKMDSDQRRQRF